MHLWLPSRPPTFHPPYKYLHDLIFQDNLLRWNPTSNQLGFIHNRVTIMHPAQFSFSVLQGRVTKWNLSSPNGKTFQKMKRTWNSQIPHLVLRYPVGIREKHETKKKKITVLCPWHDGVFPQIGPPLRLRQRIIFFQFSVADCVEVLYHVSILYTWEQFCAVIWKKIWKQWWALAMWQLAIASINQSFN